MASREKLAGSLFHESPPKGETEVKNTNLESQALGKTRNDERRGPVDPPTSEPLATSGIDVGVTAIEAGVEGSSALFAESPTANETSPPVDQRTAPAGSNGGIGHARPCTADGNQDLADYLGVREASTAQGESKAAILSSSGDKTRGELHGFNAPDNHGKANDGGSDEEVSDSGIPGANVGRESSDLKRAAQPLLSGSSLFEIGFPRCSSLPAASRRGDDRLLVGCCIQRSNVSFVPGVSRMPAECRRCSPFNPRG